jgi:hypothetical protein
MTLKRLRYALILYVLFDLFIGGYNGGFFPLTPLLSAQVPLGTSQTFTETVTLAPPALNNNQSFSNGTATGFSTSTTGGSIAAGTYRCGVTLYTATNTETPLSVDTAATSTITTTGATSTVTIYPPVPNATGAASGAGGNVVGWRPYCGVTTGASGAETLVVLSGSVCTLSSSSTPSCSLSSPAVLTLQSQFAAGSGGPATPGTAIFPPLANQANQAIVENSQFFYHAVYWVVAGTAPSACTFNIQEGSTLAGLANVGQTITCTGTGSYALPLNTKVNYSAINLATYTPGDTTTVVTFYEVVQPFNPLGAIWFGPVAPTSACSAATSGFFVTTAVPSTIYTCVTTTWTAVTLP